MNFGAIFNLFKNHPFMTSVGAGATGLGYLKLKEDTPASDQTSNQTETQTSNKTEDTKQSKAQEQSSQQKTQKHSKASQPKHSKQSHGAAPPPLDEVLNSLGAPPAPPAPNNAGIPVANAPASTGDGDGDFKSLQQQFYGLFSELDKYRQEYDIAVEKHLQTNDLYEKQLLATLPTMSLLLSKTPLNSMTNEDLLQHTTQLFTSMPYGNALENFSKLTKGYYLAKMNNVNPSELSTTDLIAIADNPVLAKSADENLAGYLEQVGEVLKLKIKSNLDEVGALKEAFANYKKELEEKGKLLKDLIDLKKVQMTLGLNQFKAEEMARHHQTTEEIQKERNDLKAQHDRATENIQNKRLSLQEQKANTPKSGKKEDDNGGIPKPKEK
jgi:hypothetical protein